MNNRILRLIAVCGFLFALASTGLSCINPIGRSSVSEPISIAEYTPEEVVEQLSDHVGSEYWVKVLADLKIDGGKRSGPIEYKMNTAVALLHLGMVQQAIGILEQLERTKPGLYHTAANLGTAYELNGENAKALKWISEGINRDPYAHHGSEWLHVRILEAKLALEKDPNWLSRNSVLGLEKIADEKALKTGPVASGNRGKPIDLSDVEDALIYQLHERLEFIKPPEAVVANLLFDLSRIFAHTRSSGHAEAMRTFAQTYGPDLMPWAVPDPGPPAVQVPPPPPVTPSSYYLLIPGSILVVVAAVVAIIFIGRKRRA